MKINKSKSVQSSFHVHPGPLASLLNWFYCVVKLVCNHLHRLLLLKNHLNVRSGATPLIPIHIWEIHKIRKSWGEGGDRLEVWFCLSKKCSCDFFVSMQSFLQHEEESHTIYSVTLVTSVTYENLYCLLWPFLRHEIKFADTRLISTHLAPPKPEFLLCRMCRRPSMMSKLVQRPASSRWLKSLNSYIWPARHLLIIR